MGKIIALALPSPQLNHVPKCHTYMSEVMVAQPLPWEASSSA